MSAAVAAAGTSLLMSMSTWSPSQLPDGTRRELNQERQHLYTLTQLIILVLSPVSIQTQSLALRALPLRKQKPQETQIFKQQTQAPANKNARSKQWQP